MINLINDAVSEEIANTIKYRRYIHQHPCLSFREEETRDYLCSELDQAGIAYRKCGQNGIVAKIGGADSSRCIAFRADFDALPIQEPEGLEYRSVNPGVMHACGHDFHASALLSFARILKQHPEWLKCDAEFIFQYAEELPPGGAKPMIEDGCLAGVTKIFGFHVSEELPAGTVGVRRGKYMAASDGFFIDFTGEGGHGSRPSEAMDTVSAAATAITQINAVISRFVSPLHDAVISVCKIHGGETYNIIPERVRIEGTVRTYEPETAENIFGKIREIAEHSAYIYGANANVDVAYGYPAVVNHDSGVDTVISAAKQLALPVIDIPPTPVGEDFARYLQVVPGAFFRIGIRNPQLGAVYPLHNKMFRLDESALNAALKLYLGIYMKETNQL